jgi:GNAT superfamily N-acetyltransferase
MLKHYPLTDERQPQFKQLFTDYYNELGCEENIDHLLDEYVLADYNAGLLYIDLVDDEDECVGFVIYQIDEITNEWNFKEGWGDIREIYLTPSARKKGYGKIMVFAVELKLMEQGALNAYTLPPEDVSGFFKACGYEESQEHNCDLDCPVYIKSPLKQTLKCNK